MIVVDIGNVCEMYIIGVVVKVYSFEKFMWIFFLVLLFCFCLNIL